MSQTSQPPHIALASRLRTLVPPVRAVVEDLAEQIRSGALNPGDRLPTIRDMAEQYALSTRGISQALEQLEQLGMVERVHGSGCYVRSNELPTGEPTTDADSVYVFCPKDRPAVLAEQVVQPLVSSLQAAGLFTVLVDTSTMPSVEQLRTTWARRPPRGVIVKDGHAKTLQTIERACPPGTRLVAAFQGRSRANRRWHKVEPDEFAAYKMAAEWLIRHDRTPIGLVLPEERVTESKVFTDVDWHAPAEGIREAFAEADMPPLLSVHGNPTPPVDPASMGLGEANLERLASWLSGPEAPTGMIVATWRAECIQLAATMAGRRLGKDLALVGVGDAQAARQGRYPCVSMGHQRVAEKAVQLILSSDPELDCITEHITLFPEFVEQAEPVAGE